MKSPDQSAACGLTTQEEKPKNDSSKLMARYIEEKIFCNGCLSAVEEEEIKKTFSELSTREKVDTLYTKVMAFVRDRQYVVDEKKKHEESGKKAEEFDPEPIDPELISEIKTLFLDAEVKKTFLEKYGEARLDRRVNRLSELGEKMRDLRLDLASKESAHKQLTQDLFLKKISRPSSLEATRGKVARLAQEIIKTEAEISKREKLEGLTAIKENTDVLANENYARLKEYSTKKFVWLPHFKDILHKIENSIQNTKKFPLLIGEPGGGKSGLARAAALELTGEEDIYVECGPSTGEKEMLFETEVDKEGSGLEYGAVTRGFTGYIRKGEQECEHGRAVFADEILKVSIDKIFSIVKLMAQRTVGESLHRKIKEPILPGSMFVAATNPPGDRHGLPEIPPALDREFTQIKIDYPPADQLYDFALSRLMDENGHIAAAKNELAPAFEKVDVENGEEIDDKIVAGKYELIKNPTDPKHGCLYRLSYAVRALQDSYICGNPNEEARDLLRSKINKEGKIIITGDGSGDQVILSKAILTLKDINGFMQGWRERRAKSEADFQTDSFSAFIKMKLEKFLSETNSSDREMVRAIFDHFHLLDQTPDIRDEKPLTPLEIGYLSPNIQRPLILKDKEPEPNSNEEDADKKIRPELPKTVENNKNITVRLENSDEVIIKTETENSQPFHIFQKNKETVEIEEGLEFEINNEQFTVAGMVDDGEGVNKAEYKNKIACRVGERKLYRLFSAEEIEKGGNKFESWRNKLIQSQKQHLETFFQKTVDVPKVPSDITKEQIANWEKQGMELVYLPEEDMTEDNDAPGWTKKPTNLFKYIKDKNVSPEATKIKAGWRLIDKKPKPNYDAGKQMYENDPLKDAITELREKGIIAKWDDKDQGSRFNISNDELQKPEVKTAFAKALGVDPKNIRLFTAMEWNVIGNIHHKEWGDTNTWEWYNDEHKGGFRLGGGGSDDGGLSRVVSGSSGDRGGDLGFRLLVVLS